MQTCRCRIPDWRALRLALELTQWDMARLLETSQSSIDWNERQPHHCPRRQTVFLLRLHLQRPEFVARLAAHHYAHPYPTDIGVSLFPPVKEKTCPVDGLPLGSHRRCRSCGELVGAGHALGEMSVDGVCPSCARARPPRALPPVHLLGQLPR